jgi:hypothetical protein
MTNQFKRVTNLEDFSSAWRISLNGETCEVAENFVGFDHIRACISLAGRAYPYRGDCSFVGEVQDYAYNAFENERGSLPFNIGKRQQLREYCSAQSAGNVGLVLPQSAPASANSAAKPRKRSPQKTRSDTTPYRLTSCVGVSTSAKPLGYTGKRVTFRLRKTVTLTRSASP